MVATDALKKDHRVIEKMLRLLELTSKKLENGEDVPVDILKKALDFIRNFADNYHLVYCPYGLLCVNPGPKLH